LILKEAWVNKNEVKNMDIENSTTIVEIVALLIFAGFVAWRIVSRDIPYFLTIPWIMIIVVPSAFGVITIGTAIYRG
jgi:hypothetical protein